MPTRFHDETPTDLRATQSLLSRSLAVAFTTSLSLSLPPSFSLFLSLLPLLSSSFSLAGSLPLADALSLQVFFFFITLSLE